MSNHRALSPRQLTEQKCCLCSVHGCVTCWRCAAGQPSFFFFLSSRSFYELQSVTLLRKWRSKSSLIVQGSNSFNSRRCHVHKRSIWHVYVHVWLICFVTEEVFGTNGAIASPRSLFQIWVTAECPFCFRAAAAAAVWLLANMRLMEGRMWDDNVCLMMGTGRNVHSYAPLSVFNRRVVVATRGDAKDHRGFL